MKKAFLSLLSGLAYAAGAQELIPYNSSGKWGFATHGGALEISARYDYAEPFSEGLALVRAGGKYGFIDMSGFEYRK